MTKAKAKSAKKNGAKRNGAKANGNGHNGNGHYALEKDVEFPARTRKGKYPFEQMDVGDSFFVGAVSVGSLRSTAYSASVRLERKFAVREVDGGVRIWRTE